MPKTKIVVALVALCVAAASFVVFSGVVKAEAQTLAPTADSYVQADKPTLNAGGSSRWSVSARTRQERVALLRFTVSVPTNEKITSVRLRAHTEAAMTARDVVAVYSTTADWAESDVTWQTAPPRGSHIARTQGPGKDAWLEWDVTTAVPATGGQVDLALTTATKGWLGFTSRENRTVSERPQLVVETAPLTTSTGTTSATASPTTSQPTSPTTSPTTSSPTTPSTSTGNTADGTTAAAARNWGPVVAGDEFNYAGAPDSTRWGVYNSAGHAGNGLRSPSQMTVNGSRLVISGTPDGTTGGMSAKFDRRKYGRWEVRMAVSGDSEYHGVSILWPDSGNWPCDGEIDYAENTGDRSVMNFFHHYSCANAQTYAKRSIDATQFHNYAVEWTPSAIVGYIDGVEWFRDTDPNHQPPGPMHQTLQLDWFPDSTTNGAAEMLVDWVRVYDLTSTTSGTASPTSSTPPTTSSGSSGDVVIAAVGDMNPAGNTSTTSAAGRNAAAIAGGLGDGSIDNFIAIGDFQYDKGTCSDLTNYWGRLWGPVIPKTYWTAGPNHDVTPGVNDDVDRYMNGQCPGSTAVSATSRSEGGFVDALQFYSFDVGNWHFAVLPTALFRYDAAKAQQMTAQIDADLAAAKAAGKHLAAVIHDPYFTSDTSSHTRFSEAKPWVDVLWKHRVRLTLSGSQHNYERSCPVNNADQCVADGMTAFQVSTGGIGLRSFASSPSYIVKRFSDTWGHLVLTLKADGGFSWQFRPVSGGMQTDSGTAAP